ncbi:MAG: type II toxin-antitoxin system RelE/ParE family toxin [Alphaproteobacteria bacterium]|nr:type II toxin-antitoxin system RelE/ParE family toxin [Alphaproteobacteria bacterium]
MAPVTTGYRLSNDAVRDVETLTRYSIETFGDSRTAQHINEMEACLDLLGANPAMRRDFSRIRANLRRHEHQSHVIYYRLDGDGVLILRILGVGQDPARYL